MHYSKSVRDVGICVHVFMHEKVKCVAFYFGDQKSSRITNHKDSDMSQNKMANQVAGWYLHKAVLKDKCAIMII